MEEGRVNIVRVKVREENAQNARRACSRKENTGRRGAGASKRDVSGVVVRDFSSAHI